MSIAVADSSARRNSAVCSIFRFWALASRPE
jgi:hypothetical protein